MPLRTLGSPHFHLQGRACVPVSLHVSVIPPSKHAKCRTIGEQTSKEEDIAKFQCLLHLSAQLSSSLLSIISTPTRTQHTPTRSTFGFQSEQSQPWKRCVCSIFSPRKRPAAVWKLSFHSQQSRGPFQALPTPGLRVLLHVPLDRLLEPGNSNSITLVAPIQVNPSPGQYHDTLQNPHYLLIANYCCALSLSRRFLKSIHNDETRNYSRRYVLIMPVIVRHAS